MNRIHVYIDGTWLFNQCGKDRTLSQYVESDYFFIDFNKLNSVIEKYIFQSSGIQPQPGGQHWYYTSIITNIPDHDIDGNSLDWLKSLSYSKEQTVLAARRAGYDTSGVFEVPFKHWMPKQIERKLFQEKMVDTSLVARMVLSSIQYPQDFHVVVTGDLDMIPAISLVVPQYLEKVVLFTTDPRQWDPNMQQTSKKLTDYNFKYGPFYLDNMVSEIFQGNFVYTCDHPTCSIVFARRNEIPVGEKPYCSTHLRTRPARR
jgi:hypothetical protein